MGENSKIEWTDHTFNPWIGCTKVSAGCAHCYAESFAKRTGLAQWGDEAERVVTSDANWRKPLKWDREAAKAGRRARVFCASLSDVFEDRPEVAADRGRLWHVIESTPNLIWLLLTKRPHLVEHLTPTSWHGAWPENAWLGVTIENQAAADARLPVVDQWDMSIGAPVFLSCEPLLGPLDISLWLDGIGWVIVGGESGHDARPMRPDWARSIRAQCHGARVPFFFKQWGEWTPLQAGAIADVARANINRGDKCGRGAMQRVGKKAAGRLLDGREWNEVPKF